MCKSKVLIMNLVYSCVFYNLKYAQLLHLLLGSFSKFCNNSNIFYLVLCDKKLEPFIKEIFLKYKINGDTWCLEINSLFQAGTSRLRIFDYNNITKFNKILYLDCDVLITNPIDEIWNTCKEEKCYVMHEKYNRKAHFYLFNDEEYSKINKSLSFTSAVILFKNCNKIKDCFTKIYEHTELYLKQKKPIPMCIDQPFIVYHLIKNNLSSAYKVVWRLVALSPLGT